MNANSATRSSKVTLATIYTSLQSIIIQASALSENKLFNFQSASEPELYGFHKPNAGNEIYIGW